MYPNFDVAAETESPAKETNQHETEVLFEMTHEKREALKKRLDENQDRIHEMAAQGDRWAIRAIECRDELHGGFDRILDYMKSFPEGKIFTAEEIEKATSSPSIIASLLILHQYDEVIFDYEHKAAILGDGEKRGSG